MVRAISNNGPAGGTRAATCVHDTPTRAHVPHLPQLQLGTEGAPVLCELRVHARQAQLQQLALGQVRQ